MEFKGTPGNWIQSHRKLPDSKKGYYSTQVYTENGETIATIHWYPKPIENNVIGTYRDANALLISKAPEMLQELQETLKDLLCIQGSIYDSSRIDARWEGVYDIIQKQIDRKKELIKQATEL